MALSFSLSVQRYAHDGSHSFASARSAIAAGCQSEKYQPMQPSQAGLMTLPHMLFTYSGSHQLTLPSRYASTTPTAQPGNGMFSAFVEESSSNVTARATSIHWSTSISRLAMPHNVLHSTPPFIRCSRFCVITMLRHKQ